MADIVDVAKPLYDSEGYEHHFVTRSSLEIVTKRTGIFCIWDARTGACLREGVENCFLTNTPLSADELARRKEEGRRILEELHAQAQGEARTVLGMALKP